MTPKRAQNLSAAMLIAILLICFVCILFLLGDGPITNREKRMYVVSFLILFLVFIFIMVMVRNSVVANTAFLIRLRDTMTGAGRSMDDLKKSVLENTKEMKDLNRHLTAPDSNETPQK